MASTRHPVPPVSASTSVPSGLVPARKGEARPGLPEPPETAPRTYVQISVRNLRATREFYARAFGLELERTVRDDANDAPKLRLRRGGMTICWVRNSRLPDTAAPSEPQLTLGFRLSIEVGDIWVVVDAAVEAGAVLGEVYETDQRCVTCVRDPDGVTIELYFPRRYNRGAGRSNG